jgi:hypothetical protein
LGEQRFSPGGAVYAVSVDGGHRAAHLVHADAADPVLVAELGLLLGANFWLNFCPPKLTSADLR